MLVDKKVRDLATALVAIVLDCGDVLPDGSAYALVSEPEWEAAHKLADEHRVRVHYNYKAEDGTPGIFVQVFESREARDEHDKEEL